MGSNIAFVVCGPRDWIDVLTAVGPTVAAGVAVAVAVWQLVISHLTSRRERERAAPRVSYVKGVTETGGQQRIYLAIKNDGETRAIVRTLEITVDGQPFVVDPTQPQPPQWANLLQSLGVVGAPGGEGTFRVPPFSIAAGQIIPLLSAPLQGVNPDLPVTVRNRLRCSGTYVSIWGEERSFPTRPEASTAA